MLSDVISATGQDNWLATYKTNNAERLKSVPDFAVWLETQYIPIAGGWQY